MAALLGLIAAAGAVQAQSVAMTGGMGSKALLVIDGTLPKAVGVGDTHKGVKVISVNSDQTVVEVNGKRQTVVLGGAPVSIGGGAAGESGSQIVLTAVSHGHFMAQGSVNGRSTQFLVDTGASTVAMGAAEADRIGIKYENGRRIRLNTANGVTTGYLVTLNRVRIQDVEVFNVEATISPQPMPYMLLGNSFLTRFQMNRHNDTLTLTRRY